MAKKQEPHNEKPISLKPLTVEEALRRAMQTPPEHRQSGQGKKKISVPPGESTV